MRKSEATIKARWNKKIETMKIKADYKYNVLFEKKIKSFDKRLEYEKEKNERKKMAYIRRMEEKYHRSMLNEIREWKGRPKRVYKTEWPKIKPLQFALKLAQENARLRDTDKDWMGYCISCGKYCSWEELAGWHRYSRKFTNMCLEKENLNAQCHTCNWTTWPRGNPEAKIRVNEEYDRNIIKKYGEWAIAKLKWLVVEYTHRRNSDPKKWYDFKKKMPELIKENERLWNKKSEEFRDTHKPFRDWWRIWTEYDKRH